MHDNRTLNSKRGLPQSIIDKLLPVYFQTRDEDLLILSTALNEKDFIRAKQIAHRIKGSAGSYGFCKLSKLAEKLEKAAENKKIKDCLKARKAIEMNLLEAKKVCLA